MPPQLVLTALFFQSVSFASNRATQIIRDGEEKLRGQTTQAQLTMTIQRPEYSRVLKIRSWTDGRERALVEIIQPVKEQGSASLRIGNQMWNYLPRTDQVIRVPTSLMLQSWMGSDFTNDDLMKSSSLLRDYHHRILRREMRSGKWTWVIECLPKAHAPVVWGKILYWARQGDHLPLREIYFDDAGKTVRVIDFSHFRKMDDRVIPTVIKVRRMNEQSLTQVRYERILYDKALPSQLFSRHQLRRTSQQVRMASLEWSLRSLRDRNP